MKVLTPFPTAGPGQTAPPAVPGGDDVTRLLDVPEDGDAALAVWRPTLEVVSGNASPRTLAVGADPVRIGRAASNDLVVSDDLVSRSHAEIRLEGGSFSVHDLDSSNGVAVDDVRVRSAALADGARIRLGGTVLAFHRPAPRVSEARRLELLAGVEVLGPLAPESRARLAAALVARFVPRRGMAVGQGLPLDEMLFVERGTVRVVAVNDEGGEVLVDRLGPGASFGEKALLAPGNAEHSLVAETDVCLLALSRAAVDRLVHAEAVASGQVVQTIRTRLRAAQAEVERGTVARSGGVDALVRATDVTIVGEDGRLRRACDRAEELARGGEPLLVTGDPGTGKRTIARHYHRSGQQPDLPYVELSLAELPPDRVGEAIFGVEPGAGATGGAGRIGYLEMLGEGTLAIVGAERLGAHEQAVLAGYLGRGWFHRAGGETSVRTAVRVVLLASGEGTAVLAGLIPELRRALGPRTVHLPPLAQRVKDIPLLAEHYLRVHAARSGKGAVSLSREATDRLVSYAWPGNVAELVSVVERAAIVSGADAIIPADLIFVAPPEKEIHKLNLLRDERVREVLRRPRLMATLVAVNLAVVGLVTVATLWGGTRPPGHPLREFANNAGMLVTWLVWFPLLPVSAFLAGRVWCGVCPIAGFGDLVSRLRRYRLPVPRLVKRADFWLLAGSFVLVDYLEELAGVADAPFATALFLLVILYVAAAMTVLFERKAFCRYVCPLAGVLGAYSTMSPIEVRGNRKVCQSQCGEHSCYKGTDRVEGCPLGAYPASIASNAECMMCANCVKSCSHRGVQLNLRPPLSELWRNPQPTLALSLFGVALVGLMARHQLPNLGSWAGLQQRLGWSDGTAHTVSFLGLLLAALAGFALSAALSAAASRESLGRNMARYGLAFIPLAFAGHLAHVAHEALGGGGHDLVAFAVKLYQRVFAGVPIGSRAVEVARLVDPAVLTFVKFVLVAGGATGSLVALVMIARRAAPAPFFPRLLPHALLLVVMFAAYVAVFTGGPGGPVAASAPAAAAGAGGAP